MVIYKAGSIHAMRSWIMSWGKRVEVRSPLELIRLMEDEIKSLAQSYDVKL
jgi:predicted DNA-binding transcriptional regulator YafY